MTSQPSHDEWEEKIIAKLAGDLDPSEFAALDDHLQFCPQCAQLMKEYTLLSSGIHLIQKDDREQPLPLAVMELKKEINQWHILEESHRIVEEGFQAPNEQHDGAPIPPQETSAEIPGGDDHQPLSVHDERRTKSELPLSASFPTNQSAIAEIYVQCSDRFFEVSPHEVENAELMVEDLVSRVLLDLFGEGTIEEVTIRFSSQRSSGLQQCSIYIRANCAWQDFTRRPRTKVHMERSLEIELSSLLREIFGHVKVNARIISPEHASGQVNETQHGDQKL